MSTATRIYKVTSMLDDIDAETDMGAGAPIARLVRATNVAQALRHVAADWLARDKAAMPAGCTTPTGCRQHGCRGECLPDEGLRIAGW